MARDQAEKKTVNVSIRMTAEQKHVFEERAKITGVKPSNYIVNAAFHAHELDPKTRVMMQNLLNDAVKAVQQYDPERAKEIEKRGKEIWL